MTVARMRWPGSISGRPVRRLSSPASAAASGLAISPNSCVLVAENVFGDAAGERQRGRRRRARQRLGEQERLAQAVERRADDHVGRDRGEALRDLAADGLDRRAPAAKFSGRDRRRRAAPIDRSASRRRPHRSRSAGRRPRTRERPTITPRSISASLVVPPPTSTCSRQVSRAFDSATAPEPCAASRLSSLWPAVAQTNLPASSANSSSMARALLRLIASPVRMTAPQSISSCVSPASP